MGGACLSIVFDQVRGCEIRESSVKLAMLSFSMRHETGDRARRVVDLAQGCGMKGIDWVGLHGCDAAALRTFCDDVGMPVVCYTVFVPQLADPEHLSEGVDRFRGHLDDARTLGAPMMMIPTPGDARDPKTLRSNWIRGFAAAAPFANDAGITLSFENFPGASSPFVTADDFFEAKAAVPDLRLTFDTGNCAMGEDPTVSLPRCISDVVHVHAKDYKIRQKRFPGSAQGRTGQWFSPALHGSGHVDLVGIIRILADRSYDQYVCIEYNGKKVKPEEGIRLGARYVQYLVDQTASPPTETMGAR